MNEDRVMEIWDAYDEHLNRVDGVTLIRGEPVPEGLYHLVSEILVRHTDGSFLLMQRDQRKHLGGMWEASAGGSALQGEGALDCALRELREETGVTGKLTHLGWIVDRKRHTIYAEYLCVTDIDKDGVILQEGETSAYRWISAEDLKRMPREELATYRVQTFMEELR